MPTERKKSAITRRHRKGEEKVNRPGTPFSLNDRAWTEAKGNHGIRGVRHGNHTAWKTRRRFAPSTISDADCFRKTWKEHSPLTVENLFLEKPRKEKGTKKTTGIAYAATLRRNSDGPRGGNHLSHLRQVDGGKETRSQTSAKTTDPPPSWSKSEETKAGANKVRKGG